MYDYLIVGSGLYGATFAHRAMQAGKTCLVIDKRPHLGGNVYCQQVDGINVHKYGAHIFHTSNREVWDFVNSLVEFNRYTNSPIANYRGTLYNLPFNLNTFHQMWGVTTPSEAEAMIDRQRHEATDDINAQRAAHSIPPLSDTCPPRNLEEQALLLVGRDIYTTLIKGYTEKQWGRPCHQLPPFIIRRLPVRLVYDNNYFNDRYQGIPIGGYNLLIQRLLKGADTMTDVDYFTTAPLTLPDGTTHAAPLSQCWRDTARKLVYTGPLDQYFGYRYGTLQYRTVRFQQETLLVPNYQGNAVVNYTDSDTPYTRIIEHKHFETFGADVYANPHTVISREYSTEWTPQLEPYYPVNDDTNNALADRYRQLAADEPDVIFGGRLAQYRYYDMAPIIEQVLGMKIE